MPVRRAAVLVLALASALALALVPAAQANLPRPGPIVIGKSIAGVAMGMSYGQARAVWGEDGACDPPTIREASCRYDDNIKSSTGVASFDANNGRIDQVIITAPFSQTTLQYVATGPLTRFHSAKGIHIGSTFKAVKKAYPKAKPAPQNGQLTIRTGIYNTVFSFLKSKKVYSIAIADYRFKG